MRKAPTPATSRRPVLSQTAEHALRALLYLGGRPPDELVSADRIAAVLGTPPNYTAKTLRRLARTGWVRSVRGPHGGFQLRVDPAGLSVARVVDAVDGPTSQPAVCLLGDRICDPGQPCAAHRRWTELQDRMNELMEETSVGDLLGARSEGVPTTPTTSSPSEMNES
jgi:Rrf2 family transcriptional regulator, iron-sulfur cluster assembly transcription factor